MNICSNRILLIADNPGSHKIFGRILQTPVEIFTDLKQENNKVPKYELDSVHQGEEGFQEIQKSLVGNSPYFLVFIDITHRGWTPRGWGGVETIKKILEVDSDIQTVICTDHSDSTSSEIIQMVGWCGRVSILKRPFDSVEVHLIARSLKEKWQLLQSRCQQDFLQAMVDERTAEIRATLEATTDSILVINKLSKIGDFNLHFQKLWNDLTWEDQGIESILDRKEVAQLISFIVSNVKGGEVTQPFLEDLIYNFDEVKYINFKYDLYLKNGKVVEFYARPLQTKQKVIGRVLIFRDITEQRYCEEQLSFQATHDPVTLLPNRILLVDRLQQGILQSQRQKTQIAVIYIDLDRFKNVNNSLGHNFGDLLLATVAERLQGCKRESDTLCRIAGDEFVLIVPGIYDQNFSFVVVKKIQEAIKKPFVIPNHQLYLTASIGISLFPKNGSEADELLKNASAAMCRAKSMGKNTFQYYTEEMDLQVRELLDLEQNLIRAYKQGEFVLYYQPILDVAQGTIKGTEALLRWLHPQWGMVAPQKFISVAEDTGLIIPIGEWVLRTACEQNLTWQRSGLPAIPIAVNLSGHQFKNIDTIQNIEKILDEIGYEGRYLELELTENVLMKSTAEIKKYFKRLRDRGVSFVIDDFGTGYSNLSYLMHYPVTKIKIDKIFIDNIGNDPSEVAIIGTIIAMAHSLNIKVVAEGVETEQQYRFLLENGCDEIQGFYFSKPVDVNAYTLLLKDRM